MGMGQSTGDWMIDVFLKEEEKRRGDKTGGTDVHG